MRMRKVLMPVAVLLLAVSCRPKNQELVNLPDGSTDVVTYEMEGDSVKTGRYSNGGLYYRSVKRSGLSGYVETEAMNYYPSGGLRKYALFLNDSLRFFRFYTPEGKVEDFGGNGLIYLDDETQYVDTLQTFHQSFQQLRLAIPPHCVARVIVGDEVADEAARPDSLPLELLPMKENVSGFLVSFPVEGEYNKVIYWSLQDTLANHIQKGRVWRKFVVR